MSSIQTPFTVVLQSAATTIQNCIFPLIYSQYLSLYSNLWKRRKLNSTLALWNYTFSSGLFLFSGSLLSSACEMILHRLTQSSVRSLLRWCCWTNCWSPDFTFDTVVYKDKYNHTLLCFLWIPSNYDHLHAFGYFTETLRCHWFVIGLTFGFITGDN